MGMNRYQTTYTVQTGPDKTEKRKLYAEHNRSSDYTDFYDHNGMWLFGYHDDEEPSILKAINALDQTQAEEGWDEEGARRIENQKIERRRAWEAATTFYLTRVLRTDFSVDDPGDMLPIGPEEQERMAASRVQNGFLDGARRMNQDSFEIGRRKDGTTTYYTMRQVICTTPQLADLLESAIHMSRDELATFLSNLRSPLMPGGETLDAAKLLKRDGDPPINIEDGKAFLGNHY